MHYPKGTNTKQESTKFDWAWHDYCTMITIAYLNLPAPTCPYLPIPAHTCPYLYILSLLTSTHNLLINFLNSSDLNFSFRKLSPPKSKIGLWPRPSHRNEALRMLHRVLLAVGNHSGHVSDGQNNHGDHADHVEQVLRQDFMVVFAQCGHLGCFDWICVMEVCCQEEKFGL